MVIVLNSLIFLICFFLDTVKVFDVISVFGIMPQTVLVAILCFCLYYGRERGLVMAVAMGLITDIVSASPIGAHAILFLCMAVACGVTYDNLIERNLITALAVVFVLSVGYNIITFIFQVFMGKDFGFFYALWRYILPISLYNAVVTPLLYWVIGKVYYINERIF